MLTSVNRSAIIVSMYRPRHPNKSIESAIQKAESLGWHVKVSNGHAWGRLYCPEVSREGCIISVWSTPRSAENHARHIVREIEMCPHCGGDSDSDGGEAKTSRAGDES